MRLRSALVCASLIMIAGSGPAEAQPAGRPATQRDMVGRWGWGGNCRDWIQYGADGFWRMAGGNAGEWVVTNGHYTAGPGQGASVRLMPDGSIALQPPGESVRRLVRCPTPARRRR